MAFVQKPQVYKSAINTVELGVGDKKVALGGATVYPLYSFDAPIPNAPKVGVEITDLGLEGAPKGMLEYYGDCKTIAEVAKKAAAMPGADFVCLRFEGAEPGEGERSVEDCVKIAKEVAEAIDIPLVIAGCKNTQKDAQIFEKVAEALSGRNVLFLSAKEENHKTVGASVGLAYAQKVGAESAVDINLAKQLNVLLTQLGVAKENIVMNLGSAAAGYGFEYVASTIERVKLAALAQGDTMLQMPVVTPVASETWSVKEAILPEKDMPEWGDQEQRGIQMEIVTAAACLAAGSDAVILRHPVSVATISAMVAALM